MIQSVLIALFILIFLVVIKPFKFGLLGDDMYRHALGYATVTFIICFFYDCLIEYILKIDRSTSSWTFWKWVGSNLGLVIAIAVGNYFMLHVLYPSAIYDFSLFLDMIGYTMTLAFFPLVFMGGIQLSSNLTKNLNIAKEIEISNKTEMEASLVFETKDGHKHIMISQFLYAQAMQNYIAIYTISEVGIVRDVYRLTMSKLINQIGERIITQCHRSYIINTQKIISVTGNAQGLKLKLEGVDVEIPVSRSYITKIKSLL